ncbi:MAG: acyl-CoA dehydrogenase family protein [Actinomycetota bacterium]|nr:acyl-CoA dehydrogenase family protein [Actinomycetota bacterium]
MAEAPIEEVRDEAREWIAAHWDPDRSLRDWRLMLLEAGWACPSWPIEWHGRGLPVAADAVVATALADLGAVGAAGGSGMGLAAPTILEHGSDDLKQRLLRPIVLGDDLWCQLFSEPGSGSDLAGLTTRAERDGDEWVVNGQKVWNTSAHHAHFGMLLARTNWDVPKHAGITYFALPMHQPGVDIRPLRQMNGYASFNEVFLTDVRVPANNIIGEVDGGWRVALATLAHERRLGSVLARRPPRTSTGRAVDEAAIEAEEAFRPYVWYPQRAGRADLVADLTRASPRRRDPVLRQEVARLLSLVQVAQWTAQRAGAARALGRPPGAEGSLGKLHSSFIARAAAHVHALLAGPHAMLSGPDGPLDGLVAEILVSVPAVSIAGGTDEIQHNIIGERVLDLPKEPRTGRDTPFRHTAKNTGRTAAERV